MPSSSSGGSGVPGRGSMPASDYTHDTLNTDPTAPGTPGARTHAPANQSAWSSSSPEAPQQPQGYGWAPSSPTPTGGPTIGSSPPGMVGGQPLGTNTTGGFQREVSPLAQRQPPGSQEFDEAETRYAELFAINSQPSARQHFRQTGGHPTIRPTHASQSSGQPQASGSEDRYDPVVYRSLIPTDAARETFDNTFDNMSDEQQQEAIRGLRARLSRGRGGAGGRGRGRGR